MSGIIRFKLGNFRSQLNLSSAVFEFSFFFLFGIAREIKEIPRTTRFFNTTPNIVLFFYDLYILHYKDCV